MLPLMVLPRSITVPSVESGGGDKLVKSLGTNYRLAWNARRTALNRAWTAVEGGETSLPSWYSRDDLLPSASSSPKTYPSYHDGLLLSLCPVAVVATMVVVVAVAVVVVVLVVVAVMVVVAAVLARMPVAKLVLASAWPGVVPCRNRHRQSWESRHWEAWYRVSRSWRSFLVDARLRAL